MNELSPAARDAVMDHVVRCAECGKIYRGLQEIEAEARAFDRGAPRRRDHSRVSPVWYGGLAAAAVLVVAFALPFWNKTETPIDDTLRSSAVPVPQPLRPVGPVAARPSELEWQAFPGADGYRVELSDGGLLWSSERVSGTRVALPAHIVLAPGVPYYWKVTALAGADRRVMSDTASALVSFEIAAAP